MRINYGVSVTATERWLAEIRAGRAFTGGTFSGPVAGQFSHVQLINPAGSAITVIVHDLWVALGTATIILFATHDTNLATDSGTQPNLLVTGVNSIAHIRTEDNVASLGSAVSSTEFETQIGHNVYQGWSFELAAGRGILTRPGIVNVRMRTLYNWIEV